MRLPGFHASQLVAGDDGSLQPQLAVSVPEEPLLGSWSATRWQYTRREGRPLALDVVCDLGGSITLSLSAGSYVLTWDVQGRGKLSIGGTFRVRGDQLELFPLGSERGEAVRFRVNAETLSLSAEDSAWDFEGQGRETGVEFVAVFVRL